MISQPTLNAVTVKAAPGESASAAAKGGDFAALLTGEGGDPSQVERRPAGLDDDSTAVETQPESKKKGQEGGEELPQDLLARLMASQQTSTQLTAAAPQGEWVDAPCEGPDDALDEMGASASIDAKGEAKAAGVQTAQSCAAQLAAQSDGGDSAMSEEEATPLEGKGARSRAGRAETAPTPGLSGQLAQVGREVQADEPPEPAGEGHGKAAGNGKAPVAGQPEPGNGKVPLTTLLEAGMAATQVTEEEVAEESPLLAETTPEASKAELAPKEKAALQRPLRPSETKPAEVLPDTSSPSKVAAPSAEGKVASARTESTEHSPSNGANPVTAQSNQARADAGVANPLPGVTKDVAMSAAPSAEVSANEAKAPAGSAVPANPSQVQVTAEIGRQSSVAVAETLAERVVAEPQQATLVRETVAAARAGRSEEHRDGKSQPLNTEGSGATVTPHATPSSPVPESRPLTAQPDVARRESVPTFPGAQRLTPESAPGELQHKVNVMLTDKLQQAELQLDPIGLGKMKIHLQMGQDQQVSVHFVVQHGQTREMLEQSMPRLREMLAGQGIQLGQTQVQHFQQGQQQGQQMGQQMSQQMNQEGRGRGADGYLGGGEDDGSVVPTGDRLARESATDRGIDFYA